jgi:hypothetical protein
MEVRRIEMPGQSLPLLSGGDTQQLAVVPGVVVGQAGNRQDWPVLLRPPR